MKVGVKPEMGFPCKSCGEEVTVPLTFPGGIKALFIIPDISSELLIKLESYLLEKLHLQPTELDLLPFYEYEYTLEIYNDLLKERNKQEEQQYSRDIEDKYNMDGLKSQANRQYEIGKSTRLRCLQIKMPKL